jgi:hypothetical protein
MSKRISTLLFEEALQLAKGTDSNAILGTIGEGTKGFERQAQAAKLFEEVYARSPDHPGVLHYLIHAYDDPILSHDRKISRYPVAIFWSDEDECVVAAAPDRRWLGLVTKQFKLYRF